MTRTRPSRNRDSDFVFTAKFIQHVSFEAERLSRLRTDGLYSRNLWAQGR